MRKIKSFLGIGYHGATHEEIVEYEDDATDEQINEDFQEWKMGYMDDNWWEVEE